MASAAETERESRARKVCIWRGPGWLAACCVCRGMRGRMHRTTACDEIARTSHSSLRHNFVPSGAGAPLLRASAPRELRSLSAISNPWRRAPATARARPARTPAAALLMPLYCNSLARRSQIRREMIGRPRMHTGATNTVHCTHTCTQESREGRRGLLTRRSALSRLRHTDRALGTHA